MFRQESLGRLQRRARIGLDLPGNPAPCPLVSDMARATFAIVQHQNSCTRHVKAQRRATPLVRNSRPLSCRVEHSRKSGQRLGLAPLLAGVTDDFKVVGRAAAAQDAIRSPLVLSRVHWVEPKLVAEITYLTWTADNLLRHTVYVGLREDKPAEQVRRGTVPSIA